MCLDCVLGGAVKLLDSKMLFDKQHKEKLRTELPKVYSQDLIHNLFRHPYTKIEFVMDELQMTRKTAAKYLDEVVSIGLLTNHKLGKDNYYLNDALYSLLQNVSAKQVALI